MPRRPTGSATADERAVSVRLAELVATLSLATDLGRGQPMEHTIRTAAIALRLGERVGLGEGVLSGRRRVTMDDGTTGEVGPGDVFSVAPGHDAEVVGDEPCVTVDLADDDADYAKRD